MTVFQLVSSLIFCDFDMLFIKHEAFYAGFHVFYKECWISNYFHPLCSKLYWLYPLYWKMVSCNPSLNLTVFNQLHPLFFPKFQLVVPYIASLICENACTYLSNHHPFFLSVYKKTHQSSRTIEEKDPVDTGVNKWPVGFHVG